MPRPITIIITALLGVFAAGSAHGQTVREWFRMAPCSEGAPERSGNGWRMVVDEANGYLSAAVPGSSFDGSPDSEYSFAVFRRADGARIFACEVVQASADGTGIALMFYALRGGRMVEVTRPLVPRLELADFLAPGTPPPPRKMRAVHLHYLLPRVGTTLRVEALPLDADEELEGWTEAEVARYQRLVETRRYRAIELAWDRARGVFTVGRKLPR